jgi:hypothetical protein
MSRAFGNSRDRDRQPQGIDTLRLRYRLWLRLRDAILKCGDDDEGLHLA